jgi:hypothetical protein
MGMDALEIAQHTKVKGKLFPESPSDLIDIARHKG